MEKVKRLMDVEGLVVWTYHNQRADVVCGRDTGYSSQHIDSCYRVSILGELGVRCDYFGNSCPIHPDAEVVHELVMSLGWRRAELLIQHGREAARPSWYPGIKAKIGPRINGKGKPVMIYDNNRRAIGCHVVDVVRKDWIEYHRKTYDRWWQGLDRVASLLIERPELLTGHQVRSPTAPRRPWEKPVDSSKTI